MCNYGVNSRKCRMSPVNKETHISVTRSYHARVLARLSESNTNRVSDKSIAGSNLNTNHNQRENVVTIQRTGILQKSFILTFKTALMLYQFIFTEPIRKLCPEKFPYTLFDDPTKCCEVSPEHICRHKNICGSNNVKCNNEKAEEKCHSRPTRHYIEENPGP